MSQLIYLDTNIYIDYLDGRVDNLRPLGEFAFQLLKRTFECEFSIVISSLILEELSNKGCDESLKAIINDLRNKNKLIWIEGDFLDFHKAKQISRERNTPNNDTIHMILAKKAGADYLITRNMKDFEKLQDIVNLAYPENL